MGKRSQQLGKTGEQGAEWFLKSIGAKCIEKISTPVKAVDGKAFYSKKSSIDYIAAIPQRGYVIPYGAARIEVKLCDKDKLQHSRLEDHQVKWLTDWAKLKLPAYVIWVYKSEFYMIEYPNYWFKKGKSLTLEIAEKIAVFKN